MNVHNGGILTQRHNAGYFSWPWGMEVRGSTNWTAFQGDSVGVYQTPGFFLIPCEWLGVYRVELVVSPIFGFGFVVLDSM